MATSPDAPRDQPHLCGAPTTNKSAKWTDLGSPQTVRKKPD
jgi:hypothetical protein